MGKIETGNLVYFDNDLVMLTDVQMEELGAIEPRPALQPNWEEVQDQTGETYYYHTVETRPCPEKCPEECPEEDSKADYCPKCSGTGQVPLTTYRRPNSGKT